MSKKATLKALAAPKLQAGTFRLEAFPNHEFRFRKISMEDVVWCEENLGFPLGKVLDTTFSAKTSDLCRIWFHQLQDEDAALFAPYTAKVVNRETGIETEEFFSGPQVLMKRISQTEAIAIGFGFAQTIVASSDMDLLPDPVKKTLLAKAQAESQATEATPSP